MGRLATVASGVVVVGCLLLGFVAPAGAQDVGAPAGAQDVGAPEPPGFVPGEALASAGTMVLALSPGGGKPIEVGLGSSIARYQNRTATSEGTALSLGLLQIFLGPAAQCGDRPPIIPAEQLPPVTTGDSRRSTAMVEALEVRSPGTPEGPGGVLGTQIANATADPQVSTAATDTVPQDFGVIAFDGGHTEVTTRLVGGVREATAVTTGTQIRILGGLVTIDRPRWEAKVTSGVTETGVGSFTFAQASIFGIPRAPEQFPTDFADFARGFSDFLSALGVRLTYPTVTTEEGRVTVSPMTIGLAKPPLGIDFLKPLLTFLAPLKEDGARQMIADDCNNEAVLQIVDLVLGVLQGTGSVDVRVGGVSAFTAATEFPEATIIDIGAVDLAPTTAAPVVLNQQFTAPVAAPVPSLGSSSYDLDPAVPDVPLAPLAEVALPEVAAAPPPVDTGPAEPVFDLPSASLVSRRFEPGSTGGAPALVGAMTLAGLVGLALADRYVMRRRRREIPA